MNNLKQTDKAIKKFRKKYHLLKEADDWADEKQAFRDKRYEEGWKNFSITAPPQCVAALKNYYEQYRDSNPGQFEIGKPDADTDKEKD